SVQLDGVDVRELDLASLRRGIGYLTQDPMLFNDTVRANLLYGMAELPDDSRIEGALRQAHAEFVYDLPDGLETRTSDRGIRFSGGERQRIALARALLADPTLLILDEPTSALDSESERQVQDALRELHGRTTVVVIAHRLATVMAADQLLVMEEGSIVQRGTHADLLSQDGAYRHLFESQLLRG
ncbi:ATP-binding cassette domain-containing protein, partial [bacterium]|nr:ATP-binding cassette domain-containing protein [bacterium]